MVLEIILLSLLLISALITVYARSLARSAIGLGMISAMLTILMFRLNAPYAAAFELSVATGLITVIFISAISFTKPLTSQEEKDKSKERIKRYIYLPIILAIVAYLLWNNVGFSNILISSKQFYNSNFRIVLWEQRQFDLLGQVIILLVGIYSVIVLFKENKEDDNNK